MLRIHQKKKKKLKSEDKKDLLGSNFSEKCKKGFTGNVSECPGEGSNFNHFHYFENHRIYVNEFLLC